MKLTHILIPNVIARDYLFKKVNTLRSIFHYGLDMFYEVEVETITECNLRCKYCPNSTYDRGLPKNRQLLPKNLFKKLVDELSTVKTRISRLSPHMYGEPLLDERLPDLMLFAHNRLPKTCLSIFTNGIYLTVELYQKLTNAGVKEFVITQHTPHKLKNVCEVIEYNKQIKDNVHIIYRGMLDKRKLGNRGGLVKVPKVSTEHNACITPSRRIVINYKGDVLICCDDYFGKHIFGNISNESIVDIWKKSEFSKLRKDLRKRIWKLKMCRLCRGLKY